jgi:hypothetical protein
LKVGYKHHNKILEFWFPGGKDIVPYNYNAIITPLEFDNILNLLSDILYVEKCSELPPN